MNETFTENFDPRLKLLQNQTFLDNELNVVLHSQMLFILYSVEAFLWPNKGK